MDFFRRMIASPTDILAAYSRPGSEEAWAERNRAHAEATCMAEQVTEQEAQWLADRLGRDQAITANERALLTFLQRESASLHPLLRPLVEKAA